LVNLYSNIKMMHGPIRISLFHASICFKHYVLITNFDVLLTVYLSIFISVINQLDAQNVCFTISLFHASTCFEHYVLITNFDVLLTVHLSIFISVINQLDAQNFFFTISLFHASTRFEHICSSSGGQNCITQSLVSSHSSKRQCSDFSFTTLSTRN